MIKRTIISIIIFYLLTSVSVIGQPKSVKCYYVSSSEGRDTNIGSVEAPFKTLSRAIESNADTIRLKCGDIFYEKMDINCRIVESYGVGVKPVLYGVKIPKKGAWENGKIECGEWIKCTSNIWRVNLSLENGEYSGFKTNGTSFLNNAGAVVNLTTDDMNNCRKVPNYTDLIENFDFWQPCPVESIGHARPQDFDYLYLYYEGNPNDYDLGLTMGTPAINIQNGEVRDLNIKYWGFGITVKDNVTISDCCIDGIGGYIQIGYHKWTLFGNAIECWVSPPGRHKCLIENCYISRIFDCGATIQGSHSQKSIKAENIIFRNNTFKNCCQSFEEFLRGTQEDDLYYNCVFEDNISIDAGIDTGFRYFDNRYKRCHFLSNSILRNTNILYRNNVAINGNYYCAGAYNNLYRQAIWQDNTCHIKRGQDLLGNYSGTKDVIKIPTDKGDFNNLEEATDSAITRYRYLTGDQTTKFIIIE